MHDEPNAWVKFQRTGRIEDYLDYVGYLKLENRRQGLVPPTLAVQPHIDDLTTGERMPDANSY
jgi:hypothetical protein